MYYNKCDDINSHGDVKIPSEALNFDIWSPASKTNIVTKNKSSKGLFENLTLKKLQKILSRCHKSEISIGLAGKLQLGNLINLLFLNPNILGFRGAICKTEDRNSDICLKKVKNLFQSINFEINKAQEVAGACIEA